MSDRGSTDRNYRDDDDNYDPRSERRNDRDDRDDCRDDRGAGGDGNASLHLSALAFESTEESIRRQFEKFGPVEKVSLILDPVTYKSRGFGFIKFENPEDADKALEAMNGVEFEGRRIKVDKAKRAEGYSKTPGQYMGNPILRSKYKDDRRGGGYRRDNSRDRRYPSDRYRDYDRDFRRDDRYDRDFRRDDRDRFERGPRYDDRDSERYPPRGYDDRRGRDDYR